MEKINKKNAFLLFLLMIAEVIILALISYGIVCFFHTKAFAKVFCDSYERINNYAQIFDADTENLFSSDIISYGTTIYNLDGPLAVMFDENYTEDEKQYAVSALDEVFEILHNINPVYSYKICNKEEYRSAKKKLYFDVEESDKKSVKGRPYAGYYMAGKNLIMLHRPSKNKSIFMHELLHACGVDDVYKEETKTNHGNSLISTYRNFFDYDLYDDYMPNDVRLLAVLNIDKKADINEIQRVKEYVDNYEKNYKDKLFSVLGYEEKDINVSNTFDCFFTCDYNDIKLVKIAFENNNYQATIYNETGKFLEHIEGSFKIYDNTVVITNFNTTTLFADINFDNGGIYTLYIFATEENNKCEMYSIFHNQKFTGTYSKWYKHEKK